jgi:hypothetical protein
MTRSFATYRHEIARSSRSLMLETDEVGRYRLAQFGHAEQSVEYVVDGFGRRCPSKHKCSFADSPRQANHSEHWRAPSESDVPRSPLSICREVIPP